MTAARTSDVSIATVTIPPVTPIVRDHGSRLLEKLHAIRPMLADRDIHKKVAAIPATGWAARAPIGRGRHPARGPTGCTLPGWRAAQPER